MKVLIGLLVIAAGVLIGWFVIGRNTPGGVGNILRPGNQNQAQTSPTPSTTVSLTPGAGSITPVPEGAGKGGAAERSVVTYTDSGFSPATVTIKVGTTVAFMNESSGGMWVASAQHPTHQELPGFDQLRSVSKGGSYEYTFTKTGTWKYHNHVKAGDTAQVVVTQ